MIEVMNLDTGKILSMHCDSPRVAVEYAWRAETGNFFWMPWVKLPTIYKGIHTVECGGYCAFLDGRNSSTLRTPK